MLYVETSLNYISVIINSKRHEKIENSKFDSDCFVVLWQSLTNVQSMV